MKRRLDSQHNHDDCRRRVKDDHQPDPLESVGEHSSVGAEEQGGEETPDGGDPHPPGGAGLIEDPDGERDVVRP